MVRRRDCVPSLTPASVPAVMGIIGQMQGLVLVTRPAAKRSGTATRGRCCSASDRPDSTTSRVATDEIITTLRRMSRTAFVAGASGLVGRHLLQLLLADAEYASVI